MPRNAEYLQIPEPSDQISEGDLNRLTSIYAATLASAVETRQDSDRMAFRYTALVITIFGALQADLISLHDWIAQAAMTVFVAVLTGVMLLNMLRRAELWRGYVDCNAALEAAIGLHTPGRFVKDRAVFERPAWRGHRSDKLRHQQWSLLAVFATGLAAVLAIWL